MTLLKSRKEPNWVKYQCADMTIFSKILHISLILKSCTLKSRDWTCLNLWNPLSYIYCIVMFPLIIIANGICNLDKRNFDTGVKGYNKAMKEGATKISAWDVVKYWSK